MQARVFYVCFVPMKSEGIFGMFGVHVFAMRYELSQKRWVKSEWSSWGLDTDVLDSAQAARIFAQVYAMGGEIVRFRRPVRRKRDRRPWPRLGFWCVPLIKELTGLKAPLVLSPGQLRRALLARGGSICEPELPEAV